MPRWPVWSGLAGLVRAELHHLATFNTSERRWHMPACAALAAGLPVLLGAYLDHMAYGMVASLGGVVFLYTPNTALSHRMVSLMASAFGLCACYTLGLVSHYFALLLVPVLSTIAVLVTMVCRFYAVGPPGSLFFIMAAALGAYTPIDGAQLPVYVGLLFMGCLQACLIAFFYSLYVLPRQAPMVDGLLPAACFDFVVVDAFVIGLFVGIALALAQLLQLERAYWVSVSCLAVMQGAFLRAVWNKQVHRILGTGIGLVLAWGLLTLPLDAWGVALMVMLLGFMIEMLVVRHYALAVLFITPMTLFLAEGSHLGQRIPDALLQARLLDTVLGSVVGWLGGVCLHSPRFREPVGRCLRRLLT